MTRVAASARSVELLLAMQQTGPVFIEKDGSEIAVLVTPADYAAIRQSHTDKLLETMDELGAQAERNGMTPEILEEILAEWDAERKAARAA